MSVEEVWVGVEVLSDEEAIKALIKELEQYNQKQSKVKDVHSINVDDSIDFLLNATIKGNKAEISGLLETMRTTAGVKKVFTPRIID
jgi:hypothetical protein